MGGRGTFGTKQNKLDRQSIVNALHKQGMKIAVDGKLLTDSNMKNLSNTDLSVLKDFIGKKNSQGKIVNLTKNISTEYVGRAVVQTNKTLKSGKKQDIVQVNRTMYNTRGIKFFNKIMKDSGYTKGIKSYELNAKTTKKKVVKQKNERRR